MPTHTAARSTPARTGAGPTTKLAPIRSDRHRSAPSPRRGGTGRCRPGSLVPRARQACQDRPQPGSPAPGPWTATSSYGTARHPGVGAVRTFSTTSRAARFARRRGPPRGLRALASSRPRPRPGGPRTATDLAARRDRHHRPSVQARALRRCAVHVHAHSGHDTPHPDPCSRHGPPGHCGQPPARRTPRSTWLLLLDQLGTLPGCG